MRRACLYPALGLALALATATHAQTPEPEPPADIGGALLEGLLDQLAPALRDLGEAFGELSGYEPPEFLPNGDILIRKKPQPPAAPKPEESIDL